MYVKRRIGISDLKHKVDLLSIKDYLCKIDFNFLINIVAFSALNPDKIDFNSPDINLLKKTLFGKEDIVIFNRPAILTLLSYYYDNMEYIEKNRINDENVNIIFPLLIINEEFNKNEEEFFKIANSNRLDEIYEFFFYNKFKNIEFEKYNNDSFDIYK